MKKNEHTPIQKVLIGTLIFLFVLTPIAIFFKIDFLFRILIAMFLFWCIIGFVAQP